MSLRKTSLALAALALGSGTAMAQDDAPTVLVCDQAAGESFRYVVHDYGSYADRLVVDRYGETVEEMEEVYYNFFVFGRVYEADERFAVYTTGDQAIVSTASGGSYVCRRR